MADDIVSRCLRDFNEDRKHHDQFVTKVDRWYRAWRGVLEFRSNAAQWRSKHHPPYILQVIETLAAGTIDPNPEWKIRPRPKAADLEMLHTLGEASKQLGWLLAYQRSEDMMVLKQRQHRLQGLITGLSVWKTYWEYQEKVTTRQQSQVVYDDNGLPAVAVSTVEDREPLVDRPCVEVVDVRDFIWPEAATCLEKAQRITHRVWMHYDELLAMQQRGVYSNVEKLREVRDQGNDLSNREEALFSASRTKDMIEVLECWIEGGKRVVTIGARNTLLADRPNPFAHGKFPFVTCAPIPDLYRIPGVSVVELVEHLQEMLWTLQGQRLDNLEILNNLILLVRDDTPDINSIEFAPGAQWVVSDDKGVMALQLPEFPAKVSLEAEGLIKADIQNIPGASPALLGQAEAQEQTATEVSLVANLAQRRLSQQKFQFTMADTQVCKHWIELNKQFLTEEKLISIIGADGEESWQLIRPGHFRDVDFDVVVEQMDESLVRQERLAESQARLQVATQVAPVFAAVQTPLNLKAFMDDYLEAAGVQERERYYSAMPQPGQMQPGQGQQGQAPTPEQMLAGGTAPQAVDATSPSNQFSMSPVAGMQRMLAGAGGPVNV